MKALVLVALAAAARPAHAKGCHEVSDVVGYEHCSRFGTWSRDQPVFPLRFEFGWLHQDFPTQPFTLSNARVATQSTMPNTVTDGISTRFLGGNRLFYGGLEMDASSLVQQPQFSGLPSTGESSSVLTIEGVHVSWWRLSIGAELATGVRATVYAYCSEYKNCPLSDTEATAQVDARIRVEMFPAQRWSVGVLVGHSLLDATDRSFMVYTGIHFRALDGMY